jgi:hypothetical protein
MVHHLETVLRYVSSFRHLLTGQLRMTELHHGLTAGNSCSVQILI